MGKNNQTINTKHQEIVHEVLLGLLHAVVYRPAKTWGNAEGLVDARTQRALGTG